MQYRVTGTIGDLAVDLVVESPRVERKTSAVKVSAISDGELSDRIAECRDRIGGLLSSQAEGMVALMAEQNKTGRVSLSRAYREVWADLDTSLSSGRYSREQLEYGMGEALARGKASVGYAKAAARSWGEEHAPSAVPAMPKYRTVGA